MWENICEIMTEILCKYQLSDPGILGNLGESQAWIIQRITARHTIGKLLKTEKKYWKKPENKYHHYIYKNNRTDTLFIIGMLFLFLWCENVRGLLETQAISVSVSFTAIVTGNFLLAILIFPPWPLASQWTSQPSRMHLHSLQLGLSSALWGRRSFPKFVSLLDTFPKPQR